MTALRWKEAYPILLTPGLRVSHLGSPPALWMAQHCSPCARPAQSDKSSAACVDTSRQELVHLCSRAAEQRGYRACECSAEGLLSHGKLYRPPDAGHFAAGAWNAGPRVVRWLGNGTSDSQEGKNNLRYHANCSLVLEQSSWHCSDCFATIAQVQKKIKSFCHSDKNRWAPMHRPAIGERHAARLNGALSAASCM